MDRSQSVFELFPETQRQLETDLERDGSDLAGVNAEFTFREYSITKIKKEIDSDSLNVQHNESNDNQNFAENIEIKKEELDPTNNSPFPSYLNNSLSMSCPIDSQPIPSRVIPLEGLELTLPVYAAKFLILAIKDRIRHGRHFTFKSGNLAVTFVAESVTGSVATKALPFVVLGYWIQVLIPDDLIPRMLNKLEPIDWRNTNNLELPISFEWPDMNFKIVIVNPQPLQQSITDVKEESVIQ